MAKTIKGVTCKNGYWYARIAGSLKYCGKGDKGYNMAKAAREKWNVKQYENREINAGLKVKKVELKKIIDLSNWYMTLPTVQEQRIYPRKVIAIGHLVKYFGRKKVDQLEADDQERYRSYRKAQGVMDGTVDIEIRLLSAMYHLALKRKKIHSNTMPGEFVIKGKVNPRKTISDAEFKKLLDHAEDKFKDVLICGYESGMRASEIYNLTAGQVHLDVKHISGAVLDYIDLGIFDTKTSTKRNIPISAELKEVLQRRLKNLESDDHIFTIGNGSKVNQGFITYQMRMACENAGIIYGDKPVNKKGERIGIVFHCLRHTRTTRWVEAGFSDEIIRRATGHKSLEAYRQYVKLDPHVVMRLVENQKRDKRGTKTSQNQGW